MVIGHCENGSLEWKVL